MDRCVRARARAYRIGRAPVIPIRDQNPGDTTLPKLVQILCRRLRGIDAEIPAGMADEMIVEVIAVRRGKPRPRENVRQYLSHLTPDHHTKLSYPVKRVPSNASCALQSIPLISQKTL
jgi:hypothetical protein